MDIKDIFKKSFQYNASPLSLTYNIGRLFSDLFGSKSNRTDFADIVSGFLQSMAVKITGSELTGAERELNAFNAGEAQKQRNFEERMANTQYQRGVNDMTAAGLNPAALFGSGQPAPTPSGAAATAGGFSPSGLGDLMALISLPAQLKKLSAETKNIDADTNLTNTQARTEEQRYVNMTLVNDFYPNVTQTAINEALSRIDVNTSNKVYIDTKADAQRIVNDYLPYRQHAELQKIHRESANIDADTRYKMLETSFLDVQYEFARKNKFLMSSSDTLMTCVYIASLLGLSTESVTDFVTNKVPSLVRDVAENSHLGTPGGPHK